MNIRAWKFIASIFGITISGDGQTASVTLSAQSPNKALLGAASGTVTVAPAFRALVPLDLGTGSGAAKVLTIAAGDVMYWATPATPLITAVDTANGLYMNGSTLMESQTSGMHFGAIVCAGSMSAASALITAGTITTFTATNATITNITSSGVANLGTVVFAGTTGSLTAAGALLMPGLITGGSMGVGTSTPSQLFEIYTNTNGRVSGRVTNPNAGSSAFVEYGFVNDQGTGSGYAGFFLNSSTRATDGGTNSFNFFNDLGKVRFRGSSIIFAADTSVTNSNGVGTNFDIINTSAGGRDWQLSNTGASNGLGVGKFLIYDNTSAQTRMCVDSSGRFGFKGVTSPTATIHIAAGSTAASSSPLKFTSGALMTTAEAGSIEYQSDNYYATISTGAARKGIVLNNGSNLTSGNVPVATTTGYLQDSSMTATGSTLSLTSLLLNGTALGTEVTVTLGPVTLTNATPANVGSISLAPALWLMTTCVVEFSATTASTLDFKAGQNLTSATFGVLGSYINQPLIATGLTDAQDIGVPVWRFDFRTAGGNTPVYIIASSSFTLGTVVVNAFARAVVIG